MTFNIDASGTGHANAIMWRLAVNNLVINAIRYGAFDTRIWLCAHAAAQRLMLGQMDAFASV